MKSRSHNREKHVEQALRQLAATSYTFTEEAVVPYLWILAAQKRFLENRKAADAQVEAAKAGNKAATQPQSQDNIVTPEKAAVQPTVATGRAAGRP